MRSLIAQTSSATKERPTRNGDHADAGPHGPKPPVNKRSGKHNIGEPIAIRKLLSTGSLCFSANYTPTVCFTGTAVNQL